MRTIAATSLLLVLLLTGCATRAPVQNRSDISRSMEERTGHGLGEEVRPDAFALPKEITLQDGLTRDEAVAIALWNNKAFQADLAELGFARADLIEAGLLRNPILSFLLPLGPKQFEATATWPIEAFWQRPRRIAAALLDAESIAENLVQNGLNLVRDVKVAHSDLLLAEEQSRLANESFSWQGELAELMEARLRAGDISELEANAARSQARMAEADAARKTHDVATARDRLRFLLGMSMDKTLFQAVPSPDLSGDPGSFDELLADAFVSRPDLRAAEIAMQAAGERAGWEDSKILNLSAILDINGEGREGFEAGPGMSVEIPVFNTNQGGRARASAEIERTARNYLAVQHLIAAEVRQAVTQHSQAAEALQLWQFNILPPLEESLQEAESAYAAGDVSYLSVVESTLKLVEARLGEAAATADLRRANAELDRSIGRSRVEKP